MKILVNKCFGGFSLSKAVFDELGVEWDGHGYLEEEDIKAENIRTAPRVIAAVEKLGCEASSGMLAEVAIVEIPDGVEWFIDDYDGIETIHEKHRSW